MVARTFFGVILIGLGMSPLAEAGCVSCGPGGECFEAAAGYSANCECRIRVINGNTICKPSGICDPSDSTSCSDLPLVNISARETISTRFISQLGEVDSLVAGAVWGAISEEGSRYGATRWAHLEAGEYKGTMRHDGRSYTYLTKVRKGEGGAYSLSGEIREDGTDNVQEFSGILRDKARSGSFVRGSQEGRKPLFTWDSKKPAN